MQREPLSEETKTRILFLGVLCNLQDQVTAIMEGPVTERETRIGELLTYVDTHPRVIIRDAARLRTTSSESSTASSLADSLTLFTQDHPGTDDTCFIMMRFDDTDAHRQITAAVKKSLAQWDIVGLRADDRQYHDELYSNIVTYMHGCGMGIAVYEHIEATTFNPNVSLEVGYMLALRKPVLHLKAKNLGVLHGDLIGKLYQEYDPADPENTIPPAIERWLRVKGIIK
jgi:hypothetical protein